MGTGLRVIIFDHIEPPLIPDNPNRPPARPPPDVVPVHDPLRPEHPDPVREPPGDKPPIAAARPPAEAWQRLRSRTGATV
jgi:hypothetical protein